MIELSLNYIKKWFQLISILKNDSIQFFFSFDWIKLKWYNNDFIQFIFNDLIWFNFKKWFNLTELS